MLAALSPSSATEGGAGFTLTVTGTNFVASSVVRWNGSNRTTTFVSGTELRAAISASDIATAGSAQITVFNPSPGGGASGALTFIIIITNQVFTLTVTVKGSGGGTVTSSPAGIACGATCSAVFGYGATVTLTASPVAGSTFTGWSGEGCSGTGTCTVTMTQARNVTATFTRAAALALTIATVGVNNPGLATTVDFYFGALLPDGDPVVFFTDLAFNSGTGRLSAPATLRPIVAGVDLTAPFVYNEPSFFAYPWQGGEPAGSYVLFLAAVRPGALADNRVDPDDIVALATATATFTP